MSGFAPTHPVLADAHRRRPHWRVCRTGLVMEALVPAIILSGFATPIENKPEFIQALTLGNPMRHFLTIVQGIFLKDLPAELVFARIWPMAAIGVVTLGSAVWLFRHRLR